MKSLKELASQIVELEQRLEQARGEYDELVHKLLNLKLELSVEAQWDLSLLLIKLKKTLNPDFNQKKMLLAMRRHKAKDMRNE